MMQAATPDDAAVSATDDAVDTPFLDLPDCKTEEEVLLAIIKHCPAGSPVEVPVMAGLMAKYGMAPLATVLERPAAGALVSLKLFMGLYGVVDRLFSTGMPGYRACAAYARQLFELYINMYLKPALTNKDGEALMVELSRCWERFRLFAEWGRRMFTRVDTSIKQVPELASDPTIIKIAVQAFDAVLFKDNPGDVVLPLLDLIRRDREGEKVNYAVLKNIVELFIVMGTSEDHQRYLLMKDVTEAAAAAATTATQMGHVHAAIQAYEVNFEVSFLQQTREYYTVKGGQWLRDMSTVEYLNKSTAVFEAERRRVLDFLLPSTTPKVHCILQQTLLVNQLQELMDKPGSTLEDLLSTHRYTELQQLYALYNPLHDGMKPVYSRLEQYGCNVATSKTEAYTAAMEQQDAKTKEAAGSELVEGLMTLHQHMRKLVAEAFSDNIAAQKAVTASFNNIMAMAVGDVPLAEIVVAFADGVLRGKRGTSTRISESELEDCQRSICLLFELLVEKDVFLEAYRRSLALRLLNGTSTSNEVEKAMVTRFKMICAGQYTMQMESMFSDMELARDEANKFQAFLKTSTSSLSLELETTILRSGVWPNFQMMHLNLPEQMRAATEAFEGYYRHNYSGRRLTWVFGEGTADVRAKFPRGDKVLKVSTAQAATLCMFNVKPSWSIQELMEATGLDERSMRAVVHPLVFAAAKILSKQTAADDKKLAPADVLQINDSFTNPSKVLKVPFVRPDGFAKTKTLDSEVRKNREFQLDSIIVRIMKTRHRLDHAQLVGEIVAQSRMFKPEPALIKRRIEDLILREYLEREAGNAKMYVYRA